ncbi:hypothetical protein FOA52_004817, partial [Chlamydomonas sp. UWO 241]
MRIPNSNPSKPGLSEVGERLAGRLAQLHVLTAVWEQLLALPGGQAVAESLPDLAVPMAGAAAAAAAGAHGGGGVMGPPPPRPALLGPGAKEPGLTPARLSALSARKLRPLPVRALALLAALPPAAALLPSAASGRQGRGAAAPAAIARVDASLLAGACHLVSSLQQALAAAEAVAEGGRRLGMVGGRAAEEAEPPPTPLPELLSLLQPLLRGLRMHADAGAAALVAVSRTGWETRSAEWPVKDPAALGDGEVLLEEANPGLRSSCAIPTVSSRLVSSTLSCLRALVRVRAHHPPGFMSDLLSALSAAAPPPPASTRAPGGTPAYVAAAGASGSGGADVAPALPAFASACKYLSSLSTRKLLATPPKSVDAAGVDDGCVEFVGGPCLTLDLELLRLHAAIVDAASECHAATAGAAVGGAASQQQRGAAAELCAQMRSGLSTSAGAMLEAAWGCPLVGPGAGVALVVADPKPFTVGDMDTHMEGVDVAGMDGEEEATVRAAEEKALMAGRKLAAQAEAAWKGRAKAVEELLSVWLSYSESPAVLLARLAKDVLPLVPPGTTTVHEVLAGYTALNPKTLPAWYRGVWEALLRQYTSSVVPVVAAYKESSTSFGARAREQYVNDSSACAQVMRALMVFVKQHEKAQSLLGTGIAGCGKFVDVLV